MSKPLYSDDPGNGPGPGNDPGEAPVGDPADSPGSHGYYEWQVSTLLLAYDVVDPLERTDVAAQQQRQQAVQEEIRDIAISLIPPDYQRDETRELPPEIVMLITRATIRRAAQITGLG